MDEIENKKWMITRLDNVIKTFEKFFEEDIEKFDNFANEENKKLGQTRNGILTSIGFLISLVIGLASLNIKPYPVESIISALLFIGLTAYLTFSIFESKANKIFESIHIAMQNAKIEIYYSLGSFTESSLYIEMFKPSDYKKFHYFFIYFIAPSLRLEPLRMLQKSMNSEILSNPARKHLQDLYHANKNVIDKAVKRYEKEKDEYESNDFISDLLKYGNLLLDYKKGISNKS